MAADICNKLEKLIPPPFVTVKVKDTRPIISKWSDLKRNFNYPSQARLLLSEISYLHGYIVRKGTQLRLEKALLLTTQVYKICQRWKKNEFLHQLDAFGNGFGGIDAKVMKKLKRGRLPSQQWGTWVIYVALRDAALLAKMKLECENATKFWLGLIASAHHWGDSLVITSILSRIWKLSSCIVEEFAVKIHPYLLAIHALLPPTLSTKWPEESWEPPDSIYAWLRNSMKLGFEPANFNRNIFKEPSSQISTDLLWKTFGDSSANNDQKIEETTIKDDDDIFFIDTTGEPVDSSLMDFGSIENYEDTGIIINNSSAPSSAKKKIKCKSRKLKKQKTPTWKKFRNYWNIFFKNHEIKLQSKKGRRQLITRIKKFKLEEQDKLIRKKLISLKTLGMAEHKSDNNELINCDIESDFEKKLKLFHTFINKRIIRLKKQGDTDNCKCI